MTYQVLNRIDSTRDLRSLDAGEIECLAGEIRDLIVRTTSITGGHLASSLGAVELAIAVHRALDTPRDRVIWDVGHQAYAHKIITGRRDSFCTLRQHGGISGFPRRAESEYDVADSGHAGCSIGLSLGLALARDRQGGDYAVAAVIGDGSMTSGVAYEAMNQAGHHLESNLIIILNDNEMSISKNVGGFASYLSRLRIKPGYTHLKEELEELIRTMPAVGDGIYRLATQVKDSLTHALVPGMLFEALGLKYVGPIDGHNVAELEVTIREARDIQGPVLIHAVTQKGRGFTHSERRPEAFHGVAPFDSGTGKVLEGTGEPTYTELFGSTMVELAKSEPGLVAVTAAMTLGTGLAKFRKLFPARLLDVGIAEQFAVTLAGGLALGGLKPVVAIYSTFLQRAVDQISQEICLQKLPVVFAIDRAGLVGEDGATHHGYFDLSYLGMLPGMVIMAPWAGDELAPMLRFALESGGPAALRFPRSRTPRPGKTFSGAIELGRGVVVREGSQVTLLALGDMVTRALAAGEILEHDGISTCVVNARFAKPLDAGFVEEVAVGRRLVVTVEDNVLAGGFGSRVREIVESLGLAVPVICRGLPDCYVQHGSISELIDDVNLSPQSIAADVKAGFEAPR